jgi:acyl carrier protein
MEWAQIAAFAVALMAVIGLYVAYEVRVRRNLGRLLVQRPAVPASDFGRTHYSDPGKAQVATFVLGRFHDLAGVALQGALPSDEIVRDLHLEELDSIATVEILNDIEAEFGIKITNEEAAATRSINDLVEIISAKRDASRLVGYGSADFGPLA